MKVYTHLKTLTLFTLLLALLFTNVTPASAAISQETKAQLNEILAENTGSAALLEIIMYLYTQIYAPSISTQSSSSNTTNTSNATTETTGVDSTKTQVCTYAKTITKSLSFQMNDPQVKTLQKLLNTLAYKDTNFTPVTTSGDGSYGNETTYYGSGTAAAVTKLQERLSLTKSGRYDTTTNTKVKSRYCGNSTETSNTTNTSTATLADDAPAKLLSGNKALLNNANASVNVDHLFFAGVFTGSAYKGLVKYDTVSNTCDKLRYTANRTSELTTGGGKNTTFYAHLPTSGLDSSNTYYYCYAAANSSNTLLDMGPVMTFSLNEIRESQLSLKSSATSVAAGDDVTLTYNALGYSSCILRGTSGDGKIGFFQVPVTGFGTKTWTASGTSGEFKLSCSGGYSRSVTVTVE